MTAFVQHGKIAAPHSSTSITTFQGLRDFDQLKMSTQGRVNLVLQFMSGNMMDILGAFAVWAKVLYTSCVQGMRYAGNEPFMLIEGGSWRGARPDARPRTRRFVSSPLNEPLREAAVKQEGEGTSTRPCAQ